MHTIKIVKVTPEIAAKWLQNNPNNRLKKPHLVNKYKQIMITNRWRVDAGEPISFTKDGALVNGQHRLYALIETNCTLYFEVRFGVSKESVLAMDSGSSRTGGDALTVSFELGEKHKPHRKSAMIHLIMNLKNNQIHQAAHSYSRGKTLITSEMIVEFYRKNSSSVEESFKTGHQEENNLVPGTFLGTLHYLFKEQNYQKATDFCNQFSTGSNLPENSIIRLLRKILISNAKKFKGKISQEEKIAIFFKAWNLYKKNKTATFLKWDKREEFPKL